MNFYLSSAWLWQSYRSFGSFGLCLNLSFANKSLTVCSPVEGFRWWLVWSSGCCREFWKGFCKQYRLSCRLWSFTFVVVIVLKSGVGVSDEVEFCQDVGEVRDTEFLLAFDDVLVLFIKFADSFILFIIFMVGLILVIQKPIWSRITCSTTSSWSCSRSWPWLIEKSISTIVSVQILIHAWTIRSSGIRSISRITMITNTIIVVTASVGRGASLPLRVLFVMLLRNCISKAIPEELIVSKEIKSPITCAIHGYMV